MGSCAGKGINDDQQIREQWSEATDKKSVNLYYGDDYIGPLSEHKESLAGLVKNESMLAILGNQLPIILENFEKNKRFGSVVTSVQVNEQLCGPRLESFLHFQEEHSDWKEAMSYHGTSNEAARSILRQGYVLRHCRAKCNYRNVIWSSSNPNVAQTYIAGSKNERQEFCVVANLISYDTSDPHQSKDTNRNETVYMLPYTEQIFPLFIIFWKYR
jgi:hypothetical protein